LGIHMMAHPGHRVGRPIYLRTIGNASIHSSANVPFRIFAVLSAVTLWMAGKSHADRVRTEDA
jgi:hypothetical protein